MGKPILQPQLLTCPCCKQVRQADEHLYFSQFVWEEFFYDYTTGKRVRYDIKKGNPNWACDACLETGLAIKGNPHLQSFWNGYPFFAYCDKIDNCRDCGNEFVFSKYKQRHWYEKLKLMIYAKEVRCHPCRYKKKMRTKLFKLLGNFNYKDMEKNKETVGLCLKLGFYKEAQHILNLVQKRYKKVSAEFIVAGKLLVEVEKAMAQAVS
ncbi:MAG: hypothetical protein EOO63_05005 [Hymenobacter sp.]|nr:MAG: hypothetical protein EOO63_05005 [Hymenobacter sp.]